MKKIHPAIKHVFGIRKLGQKCIWQWLLSITWNRPALWTSIISNICFYCLHFVGVGRDRRSRTGSKRTLPQLWHEGWGPHQALAGLGQLGRRWGYTKPLTWSWERQHLFITRHCISSRGETWKDNGPVLWWALTSSFQRDFKPQDALVPILMEKGQAASWEGKNLGLGVYDFGQVL